MRSIGEYNILDGEPAESAEAMTMTFDDVQTQTWISESKGSSY